MANNVQNKKTDVAGKTGGQQPIVLARLPRMGSAQPTPVSPAVDQTIAPPEPMPRLDLRSEIEQRTRLQITATSADNQPLSATHFVDRQHAPSPEPSPAPKQYEPLRSRKSVTQPTSLGEKLFQLHAQLAPHAGLIVAMALIASAGLLYWMIVGPANAPLPNYPTPGFERQSEGFGVTPHSQTEGTEPTLSADVSPATESTAALGEWNQIALPASQQHVALPDELALSETSIAPKPVTQMPLNETAAPAPREFPPVDELHYPTTAHHQSLDFTAIQGKAPIATADSFKEVAQRPTASSNR